MMEVVIRMMSFFKRSEVYISMIIGFFFILLGIFILFNLEIIQGDEFSGRPVPNIETVLDLVNTFFIEVAFILSNLLGPYPFPAIIAVVLILFGLLMMKVAQTVLHTTKYDRQLSVFFIILSLMLFIATTILMFQVFDWFAIAFAIAFFVHMLYNIFKSHFDPSHQKEQFMIILFFYGTAYFLSQFAVYRNIEEALTPIDVLSINIFFGVFWLLALGALWVGVFLSNTLDKPRDTVEMADEESETYSRRNRRKSSKLNPNEYFKFSKDLYDFRNKMLNGFIDFFEVGIPRWLRANHIELFLGGMAFLIILIEFNNRHGVITEGYFRLDNMNYLYQWINLATILVISLLYILATVFNMIQNKFYHRQMVLIVILWLVVTVNLFVTVMMDVELSLFILPFNVLLVFLTTPLLIISIFKDFYKEDGGAPDEGDQLP